MTNRQYPHYSGRIKLGTSRAKCECCGSTARFRVTVQLSIFRGDDEVFDVCESHAMLARTDYNRFLDVRVAHRRYMREEIEAQHEETGRRWRGLRCALPPRYNEVGFFHQTRTDDL